MKKTIALPVLLVISLFAFALPGVRYALSAINFEKIGDNGIGDDGISGDRHNSYAWSMDILPMDFENNEDCGDYLYIGSNRALAYLVLRMMEFSDKEIEEIFQDNTASPTDLRARIFRYKTDGTKGWEWVYTSSLTSDTLNGFEIPKHFGYRAMKTFTDKNGETALYVATTSFMSTIPNEILRFKNNFNPGSDQPDVVFRIESTSKGNSIPSIDGENSIRAMEVYKGYLCIGLMNGEIYITNNPHPQPTSDTTSTQGWTKIADINCFHNLSAEHTLLNWQFLTFNGFLYAIMGSLNIPDSPGGFRIFKGAPSNSDNPTQKWIWTETMSGGAGNPWYEIANPFVFGDFVYIVAGSHLTNHLMRGDFELLHENFDRIRPVILRFDKDDHWEMVIGDLDVNTRFENRLGNYRAGFWKPVLPFPPFNSNNYSVNVYIWWMEVYSDKLYCSTFDARVFLKYAEAFLDNLISKQVVDETTKNKIVLAIQLLNLLNDNFPGADLYVTSDGINWSPVTLDGFGNEYNYGIRTIKATDDGLFVGTANPFYGFQVWKGIEDEGEGCFIVSTTSGSPLSHHIKSLRTFRDTYLLTHKIGISLTNWYYGRLSPLGVNCIENHPWVSAMVRISLYPISALIYLLMKGVLLPIAIAVVFGMVILKIKWGKGPLRLRSASFIIED